MRSFTSRPASYRYYRLGFKADVIEPLGEREVFRIVTPEGTFQMTKRDFYRDFPNVVQSRSYRENGLYHYPEVPGKALKYRVSSW